MHLQLIVDVIFVRDVKDIDDFLVFFFLKKRRCVAVLQRAEQESCTCRTIVQEEQYL
jgi:hypothetical protein